MRTLPTDTRFLARRGFTLVEMLVVIAIIAVLAAMLLPAIGRARLNAQIKKAQIEMAQIVEAIHRYESTYNRFPVSTGAAAAAAAAGEDFTFGTTGFNDLQFAVANPNTVPYNTNNAEVISILLNMTNYPARPNELTPNAGYAKNPQQIRFLNADMATETGRSGVGRDLVYRDPWGYPYIISIDLNYDEKCRDAFYRLDSVSDVAINGLISAGLRDTYEFNGPVMVWSAGLDGRIDATKKANARGTPNFDNVLSWKQ